MAKNPYPEKIDVHNRSNHSYTSPSGVEIPSGKTAQLDRKEGEALMNGYPRDLISPDSLRSSPSAQSNRDQHDLIVELHETIAVMESAAEAGRAQIVQQQAKISELESGAVTDPKGVKKIEELQKSLTDLSEKTSLRIVELTNQVDELSAQNEALTQALVDSKALTNSAYAELEAYKLAK